MEALYVSPVYISWRRGPNWPDKDPESQILHTCNENLIPYVLKLNVRLMLASVVWKVLLMFLKQWIAAFGVVMKEFKQDFKTGHLLAGIHFFYGEGVKPGHNYLLLLFTLPCELQISFSCLQLFSSLRSGDGSLQCAEPVSPAGFITLSGTFQFSKLGTHRWAESWGSFRCNLQTLRLTQWNSCEPISGKEAHH